MTKHNYDWEELGGLPANKPVVTFPKTGRNWVEGYIVKIIPRTSKPWIGNFHGISGDYLSGIFRTADKDTICIIALGQGFLVNINKPEDYVEVPIIPVVQVEILEDANIIILVSFTRMAAIGEKGLMWVTNNISRDGNK